MNYDLKDILKHFNIDFTPEMYGNGHINDTYMINSTPRYILQRINTSVFKEPEKLMSNIKKVTEYLQEEIKKSGGDSERETLNFVNANDGKIFFRDRNGSYFRVYKFIDRVRSYEFVENSSQFYNAAKAFGKFQKMLRDFPAKELYEVIPAFHDTRKRYENFKEAVEKDISKRVNNVKEEVKFALCRENYVDIIVDLLKNNELPVRITHNDTKLNNVLLDEVTGNGVCVIDLDTVMPGSLLYDFGDALRFGASTATEDEKDLNKVWFDLDLFRSFTKGFLEELRDDITKKEIELLPFSAVLMTYECGIRFLEDYLNGDVYFKVRYSDHNLDRARTQFKLVADMEGKLSEMKNIVEEELCHIKNCEFEESI